jgi:Arc/MetJ-type ribon-helix-helix transcriptional regulator
METHRSNTHMSNRKKKVSFRISQRELDDIDYHVKKGTFQDRSDFFNQASSQLLEKLNWPTEGKHNA